MAKIIDGKALAMKIREELKAEVEGLKKKGITPGLAVVLLGEDPASQIYVRSKGKACDAVGIASFQHKLPAETTQDALLNLISQLNANKDVHGILVQLPLPSHMDADLVLEAIDPLKDVDGFHPYNVGKLMTGAPIFQPCTPLGIIKLLESTGTDLNGKDVLVIGRSNIVGKPIALMLLQRHATVTICHSRTKDLIEKMKRADIVVAAVGKTGIVTGETIKEGAVIIDVGMNRNADGKLVGDVDFKSAEKVASHITPVPGGVGPMTIAMLLHNTVEAVKRQHGLMNKE